jgi:GGDEF domain-containing protein
VIRKRTLRRQVEEWRGRALAAEYAATHDSMTGLLNRAGLFKLMDSGEVDYPTSDRPWYVTSLDVDGLKAVNDTAGHLAGDKLIQSAAKMIQHAAILAIGYAARTGGDEFVIISARVPRLPETSPLSVGTALWSDDFDWAWSKSDERMLDSKKLRRRCRTA